MEENHIHKQPHEAEPPYRTAMKERIKVLFRLLYLLLGLFVIATYPAPRQRGAQ